MKFIETELSGVFLIESEPYFDERGSFRRSYCKREFNKVGLDFEIVNCNVSENPQKGTLRGFHYQLNPYREDKVMTCLSGSVQDIVIDLRRDSPTYTRFVEFELSAKNRYSIVIPRGCANAWLTLSDETTMQYYVSNFYDANHSRGIRFNDPYFSLKWRVPITQISAKDLSWKNFDPNQFEDLN